MIEKRHISYRFPGVDVPNMKAIIAYPYLKDFVLTFLILREYVNMSTFNNNM